MSYNPVVLIQDTKQFLYIKKAYVDYDIFLFRLLMEITQSTFAKYGLEIKKNKNLPSDMNLGFSFSLYQTHKVTNGIVCFFFFVF